MNSHRRRRRNKKTETEKENSHIVTDIYISGVYPFFFRNQIKDYRIFLTFRIIIIF